MPHNLPVSPQDTAPNDLIPTRDASIDGRSVAVLRLPFRPPYSWSAIERFLGQRAIPSVESVEPGAYRRAIAVGGRHGVVSIGPAEGEDCLVARIAPASLATPDVVARLRRLFDLDADVAAILRRLGESPLLAPRVSRDPGLRLPGAWDGFQIAVRAILGQQVSVAGARTLAGRVAAAFGEPLALDALDTGVEEAGSAGRLAVVFPGPAALAEADLSRIGLPGARQVAVRSLARAVAADPTLLQRRSSLGESVEALGRLPGIGDWTAQYIAMRALGEPDAFPASDLGLRHALATAEDPAPKPKRVAALAEAWRPWRAYAVMHLWLTPGD